MSVLLQGFTPLVEFRKAGYISALIMVPSPRSEGPPIARWEQSLLTLAGLSGLILLSLAIWLEPNPSGFGTHQQLGLPPCTILFWFDVPCPS